MGATLRACCGEPGGGSNLLARSLLPLVHAQSEVHARRPHNPHAHQHLPAEPMPLPLHTCRSEGALSSKPPAPKAATTGKPRASGPMHRRSGSSCSAARPRSASGAASPALEGGLPRLPQQPVSLAALQLPPLSLPVPPLPPGWHGLPQVAQPQMAPQQAQQMQQAQHAEGWLDQLLPAGDAQRAEQDATQLSPADVDLLLAADSGSLPQLLHRPSAPAAASRQQAQGPAASHFSQRSQLSDGTHVAPGGAAGPPAGQAQQAQQAMVGGDISADIWDSLLADSGCE